MRDAINYAGLARHAEFLKIAREWVMNQITDRDKRIAELERQLAEASNARRIAGEELAEVFISRQVVRSQLEKAEAEREAAVKRAEEAEARLRMATQCMPEDGILGPRF